jgi:hypothetical protein
MDSSKAKRRAPHLPQAEMAGHGTEKIEMRIFAEIFRSCGNFFASLFGKISQTGSTMAHRC